MHPRIDLLHGMNVLPQSPNPDRLARESFLQGSPWLRLPPPLEVMTPTTTMESCNSTQLKFNLLAYLSPSRTLYNFAKYMLSLE
jgi:hypothetical protein